jgi:hypothetical protein
LPAPSEASGDPGVSTAGLTRAIVERGISVESVDEHEGALWT